MPDLRQQIIDLEAEIDTLTESALRCERVHFAAKALTATGAFLIAAALTGAFGVGAAAFLLGIAAALGGIAVLGSNKRTHGDMLAAIKAKTARRSELIEGLNGVRESGREWQQRASAVV